MEASTQCMRRLTIGDHGSSEETYFLNAFVRIALVSMAIAVIVSGCLGEGALPLQRSHEFREQIPTGMPRDEAVTILSEDAWYHAICEGFLAGEELFFYDNREWARSEIVILDTERKDGALVVEGIYGGEPNEWHTWYEGCYDRSMFTEQEPSPLAAP